jgi:hypothetical protein
VLFGAQKAGGSVDILTAITRFAVARLFRGGVFTLTSSSAAADELQQTLNLGGGYLQSQGRFRFQWNHPVNFI